jgi:hypothetical protein
LAVLYNISIVLINLQWNSIRIEEELDQCRRARNGKATASPPEYIAGPTRDLPDGACLSAALAAC